MKLLETLRLTPQLTRADILLTLVPILLWVGLVQLRPHFIHPFCGETPEKCTPSTVAQVDQVALGLHSSQADGYSYFTQNLSGALVATIPAALHLTLWITGHLSPAAALAAAGTDLAIALQTVFWNGAIGETVRVSVQRPRPFVYSDPKAAGANPAHYVSFYSGHTSFAAAATAALFLVLLGRGAPLWVIALAGSTSVTLTVLTGIFRVLAGRHFVSDVMVAMFAGWGIALMVAWLHRPRSS